MGIQEGGEDEEKEQKEGKGRITTLNFSMAVRLEYAKRSKHPPQLLQTASNEL
jgi:hypothetical protein